MESKNNTMKTVKKPLKDVMRAEGADLSMDKELTASLENPLFQADNKESSHGSNPAIKMEGSDKSGSGAKRLDENAFRFGVEGYFLDQMDNFTTEQNDFFQRNLFTQEMDQMANKRKLLDGLTFEEIQEKLNQELQEKASKPKKERTYVTVDELVTKTTAQTADGSQHSSDFSLADFTPEFQIERRIESEYGLNEFGKLDWEDIFTNLPREMRDQVRRSEPAQGPTDDLPGGFGGMEGGFNQNMDFGMPDFGNFNFEEPDRANAPEDLFIGEEQAQLTFSYDTDEAQTGFASKIVNMLKDQNNKKKKNSNPEKLHFADVVSKFKQERDVADLFFDLMCAARTGDIHLDQKFPSVIDKKTHLPVIEISAPAV